MNKIVNRLKKDWNEQGLKSKLLAVLGGVGVTFDIISPILIVLMWIKLNGLNNWSIYFFFLIGLFSSLFKAIKIGGWLK